MNPRLLLLSNSRDPQGRYLEHAKRHIRAFLGARVHSVLFIPFASVGASWDQYEERARVPFMEMGYSLISIHNASDPLKALRTVEAIVVGGGNTFHLLNELYRMQLLTIVRELVGSGVPYVGWSAGSVVACPTIKTTNDMPIVEPPSLDALGLVPFQINPHYTEERLPGITGETRVERIAEFLVLNPSTPVIGLPEGAMLQVERDRLVLLGAHAARLFRSSRESVDCIPGKPLDFLLSDRSPTALHA